MAQNEETLYFDNTHPEVRQESKDKTQNAADKATWKKVAVSGAAGILVSVGFTVKAYKDSSKGPLRQKQLTEEFQQHYVCPHCHHFLGFLAYGVLMQNEACPYCKAKIKK